MQNNYRNIYKVARLYAGFTQEKASELLCISVESQRAYESGRTIPPNDVVSAMIGLYGTHHLAYQHIMNSSEVARQCLPSIKIKDLPDAILQLQKEVTDFLNCRDELIALGCDGVITEEERARYDQIIEELDEVVAAIMTLKFAQEKEAQ